VTALLRDWREVPLASVAEVRLGRQRSPKNHAGEQMRPYVRAANASWSGLLLEDVKSMNFTDSEMNIYRLRPGDLLLGEASGSPREVGKPVLWRGEIADCAFQNTLIRVRPKGPDPEYLLHYFRHQALSGKFAEAARGVGIRHLGSDALAKWKVPLPSLPEQRRIAEVLDRADALRAKRREALALLGAMKQAIFQEMFVAGIQAGWPVLTVVDISHASAGSIRTGPFGSQLLHSEFTDAGIAVLGIDNAVQNQFVWGARRYISEEKYLQLKRYTVRPGDVLITIMGTCGRCAVVPDDVPQAINTKHLCCISLDRSKCLPEFLHAYFLFHPVAKQYLSQTAKGAIMEGLNMAIIKQLPVVVPPLALQREFFNQVERLALSVDVMKAHSLELQAFVASLQQRAFAGAL
jgi:type I restriction enzyme S subunit